MALKPGQTVSNVTTNRDLALVSAALGRLVRLGQLRDNPLRHVRRAKEPTRRRVVLSKSETVKLIDACDEHMRILALAALFTGARPQSELLPVKWGDIDLGAGTITIERTKVGNSDPFVQNGLT